MQTASGSEPVTVIAASDNDRATCSCTAILNLEIAPRNFLLHIVASLQSVDQPPAATAAATRAQQLSAYIPATMADKDISKEPSSSEYASETSDPDYEERPASLFGTLRTRLNWQPSSRTMHLDVRQTLQVCAQQHKQRL